MSGGSAPLSVIDTISGVSGYSTDNAGKMWRRLQEHHPEVRKCFVETSSSENGSLDDFLHVHNKFGLAAPTYLGGHFYRNGVSQVSNKIGMHKFGGQGQRLTPVATIDNLVYIISKVPGEVAKRLAEAAAETLTRYLGGDITLADEVHAIAAAQAELASTNPSHPARLFGEHVEAKLADAMEWRTRRKEQKLAGAECANEIKAAGLNTPRNHAHTNSRKNQSVIGFDISTAQFKRKHKINPKCALTEYMDKEQLAAHAFMSEVLKRKISETAPETDNQLFSCVDHHSARMKTMFGELGVHKKTLVHHEKRIMALEKTVAAQKKEIEGARKAPSTQTTKIYNFFGRVDVTSGM